MGKRKMYRGISFLLAMVMFLTSWQIPVFSEEVNTDAGNVVLAETGEDGKRVVTTACMEQTMTVCLPPTRILLSC